MRVQVKKLNSKAIIPHHGSEQAAGYDIFACLSEAISIAPGEVAKIPTGLAIKPPSGYYIEIVARSGLATKQGLRLANSVGICDEDYRGEYIVALYNDSSETRVINHGDRIAQMLLKQYNLCEFEEVEELDDTARGAGGFGSTGGFDGIYKNS